MNLVCNEKNSKTTMLCLLMILTGIFIGILFFGSSPLITGHIVINEICSNNFSLVKSETDDYCDYIELYNPGSREVLLDGYFLSDDSNDLQKYALDSVSIPPKGYYVVWLNGDGDVAAGQRNFGIASTGESVFLSDSKTGEILDSVFVPESPYNSCYGRVTDGGKEWKHMSATTGSSNRNAEILPSVQLHEPIFSVESGFYEEMFQLAIEAGEDEIIYYTLDGTEPTRNSQVYQTPLNIDDASRQENVYAARTDLSPTVDYVPSFKVDKATVVRAISYNPQEDTVSKIVTKIYFVGYSQRTEYSDLPIVSIVTDPASLFDREYGIYTNGVALETYMSEGGLHNGELRDSFTDEEENQHFLYMASNAFNDGKEWEREAVVTYFNSNHEYCFSQNVGIRTAGQSTRGTPQKSFNIYGRNIYDENVTLPYEFFPNTSYSSVKLRNGGNDNEGTKFKDAFLEELALDRNVAIQRSVPCVLFLNGEYWGIYNIRERYKEEYVNNHYNINKNNVWIIDAGVARVGGEEAQSEYQKMLDIITQCDLSYDDVYAMICELIDVQNLIDYCCINLYIDNRDISFIQNTALWRCAEPDGSEYGDGKWRWMVFDLDDTLHEDTGNSLTWIGENDLMKEQVMQSLMRNEQFRRQFCITFMDIANTTYAYDVVHSKLMLWKDVYGTQIVKDHQRFFDADYSSEIFERDIENIDNFFGNRFHFAMAGLAEEFDLTGTLETVTVHKSEGGTVKINTALIDEDEKWTGQYFTDYPVVLTAVAEEGYRFVCWNGDATGQESQIEVVIPEGGLSISAKFEKID